MLFEILVVYAEIRFANVRILGLRKSFGWLVGWLVGWEEETVMVG